MLSTSFSKTVGNKRYTLAQWQQNPPDGKTSLSTTFSSTKCGKCCKFDSSIVLCTRSQNVDIFCQGCWDEADWQCPGCNTIPRYFFGWECFFESLLYLFCYNDLIICLVMCKKLFQKIQYKYTI